MYKNNAYINKKYIYICIYIYEKIKEKNDIYEKCIKTIYK